MPHLKGLQVSVEVLARGDEDPIGTWYQEYLRRLEEEHKVIWVQSVCEEYSGGLVCQQVRSLLLRQREYGHRCLHSAF